MKADDAVELECSNGRGQRREGFTVEEIVREDGRVVGIKGKTKGGEAVSERARVVIGADARHWGVPAKT